MYEVAVLATRRKSSPEQDAAFQGYYNHHWAVAVAEGMSDPVISVVHIGHRANVKTVTAVSQAVPYLLAVVLEVEMAGMVDFLDGQGRVVGKVAEALCSYSGLVQNFDLVGRKGLAALYSFVVVVQVA